RLTEERVQGGEIQALVEYANWLKSAEPRKIDSYVLDVFAPLWKSPENPAVSAATDWLFNDAGSPWFALVTTNRTGAAYRAPDLIGTPLVALLAFQKHLFRNLADTNNV